MECDDATGLLAARAHRTLTGVETTRLADHVATCEACRAASVREDWRVLVKAPREALDEGDLVLPVVDPLLFIEAGEVSSGGMGRIVRALDRRLGRTVAIKEALSADLRRRFEREVAITARLQHPAIVPIYEAGAWPDGTAFYTMRLVPEGKTLASAIAAATTLPERLALLPHAIAVTEAIAYAHDQHVIHRDIKPANVLVGPFGETLVIDWGLARRTDDGSDEEAVPAGGGDVGLTRAGSVIGTPCFMSPDQAAGRPVDERDDVYALGALLYDVLAGHPPYWGDDRTVDEVLAATLAGPPVPLAQLVPAAPRDLIGIAERAMARVRGERYANAGELAAELERFAAGQLLLSRAYTMRELAGRWIRRHKAIVAVAGVALVAVLAVGAIAIVNITRSRDDERAARIASDADRASAEEARAQADAARLAGEQRLVALLGEQGRVAYLEDRHGQALAYLAAAFQHGSDGAAARYLFAVAERADLHAEVLAPGGSRVTAIAALSDRRVATIDEGDHLTLKVWRGRRVERSVVVGASNGFALLDGHALIIADLDAGTIAGWDVETGARRWQRPSTGADAYLDPTGKVFVVETARVGLELVDVATGTVRGRVPSFVVGAAVFSGDGRHLAAYGDAAARTVRVWSVEPFAEVATLEAPGEVTAIAFAAPDVLVVGQADGQVAAWSIAKRGVVAALAGHAGAVRAIACARGGDRILTGDASGAVRLFAAGGALLGESRALRKPIKVLAWSPDEQVIVAAGDEPRFATWNARLLEPLLTSAFARGAARIAWAADSSRLVTTGAGEPTARVWRRPETRELRRLGRVTAVGGSKLASASSSGVTVHDVASEVSRTIAIEADAGMVHLDRDGRRLLVEHDASYEAFDVPTGVRLAVHATREHAYLSGDGRYLVAQREKGVDLLDAASGARVLRLADAAGVDSVAGTILAIVDGVPRTWSAPAAEPVAATGVERVRYARLDATGRRYVAFGDVAGVVEASSGKLVAQLTPPRKRVDAAELVGDRVLAHHGDNTVAVWNTATSAVLVGVAEVEPGAHALSPDGAFLATGHADGRVVIWDVATGEMLDVLRGHRRPLRLVRFAPDGSRLVAGDGDATTVWDVERDRRSATSLRFIGNQLRWKLVDGRPVPR